MIRLLVASQPLQGQLQWTPAGLTDPGGLAAYLGLRTTSCAWSR